MHPVMKERAKEIFRSAQMYATAAHRLNASPDTLMPSIVVAALSLELLFKTLYVLDKNAEAPHSHDFANIFEKLSDATKIELNDGFSTALGKRNMSDVEILETNFKVKIHRDLKNNLHEWSSVFTGLRYVYEFVSTAKTQKTMMFFPEIYAVSTEIIYKREPTWRVSSPMQRSE